MEQLAQAMRLGKLGEQIVLKSQFAFSQLTFTGYSNASKATYYLARKTRDTLANKLYFKLLEEEIDGLYLNDIIREGVKNDDPRLPRNICK